mmetsp:Transcript_25436/g.52195  ORF Transcript_25436/g.52195 Transcript_25436/m.52195 type:complete len:87 (-) Transcript_25436:712-972(-)
MRSHHHDRFIANALGYNFRLICNPAAIAHMPIKIARRNPFVQNLYFVNTGCALLYVINTSYPMRPLTLLQNYFTKQGSSFQSSKNP